jgi:hypothetical protein
MEREMTLVFDIEANGLYEDVDQIHCLAIHDTDTTTTETYNDQSLTNTITEGLTRLATADCIVGHNIITYDIPVIRKLYPFWDPDSIVLDTLLLSRLYHANIFDVDKKRKWNHMPLQLYGRHSLESYGYRLKCYKGDFHKDADWSHWSEDMEAYCKQDVITNTKLWKHFQKYLTG